ncbi:MAG: hypothetical protein AAF790_13290 [Planctomycetota bacterium]
MSLFCKSTLSWWQRVPCDSCYAAVGVTVRWVLLSVTPAFIVGLACLVALRWIDLSPQMVRYPSSNPEPRVWLLVAVLVVAGGAAGGSCGLILTFAAPLVCDQPARQRDKHGE